MQTTQKEGTGITTSTALEVLPVCPSSGSHGRMTLRARTQTKEQAFCGVWYDCGRDGCHASMLYPSAELIAQWESMGDYRLSRRSVNQ